MKEEVEIVKDTREEKKVLKEIITLKDKDLHKLLKKVKILKEKYSSTDKELL